MTSPTYRETYPAAPASRLVELENRLGARLPEPYRAYLAGQDGDVIPSGWIPVGTDAGGGLFMLAVAAEDPGSVWYQSSELEEDDAGVSYPVVRERLAGSWTEFLSSIEVLDD
ncbi:SMI1/KNR4 family protein [Kribbella sp. NPDC048928]|uniref:SMI1/KNR4 family protein n=1 Tax=Kribbella sp. NPDC048928 TaxID=3364111 RepID=UPI00371CAA92